MKPSKRDIQKWINALRSGEYKQTREALQNDHGYCCLGVACKIFIPESAQKRHAVYGHLFGGMPSDQPSAPPWLRNIDESVRDVAGTSLSRLNDGADFTFDEIADVLQAVYIEEVLS